MREKPGSEAGEGLAAPMTVPFPEGLAAVVMPTRNQVRYIEAAVQSVLSQGLPRLKLWVQDGGSTDGTLPLLASLARQHPQLQVVSEADSGPADALNRAFARALAEPGVALLGWLNSDDLYTPGALARAWAHLQAHPEHVMVYGEGLHVDATGQPLAPYPTRGPDTPLAAWADGCHICQPTVVMRPEAVQALLPLDTGLQTAFDYDAWLRLFKAFPGRVGHLPLLQACSRLHDEGITLRQRRLVALEGLRVVRRHLGVAPAHWLLSYADEWRAQLPDGDPGQPLQRLLHLVAEAAPSMDPTAVQQLVQNLRGHRAWQVALPGAMADVQGDGWALAHMALRLRPPRDGQLRLRGRHAGPQAGPLELRLSGPDNAAFALSVARSGPFEWCWPVHAGTGLTQTWSLHCDNPFVPAATTPGSSDHRALAFQLDSLAFTA